MSAVLIDYEFQGISLVREVFIETGTAEGRTLQKAMEAGFIYLYSVELYEPLYRESVNKFKDYKNVKIFKGSSPEVLPSMIQADKPTTFWLDAHFRPPIQEGQDRKYGQCPVLAELKVIRETDWSVYPYILIDDANNFKPEHGPHEGQIKAEWPTPDQIRDALPERYYMTEHDNIFYCMPKREKTYLVHL